MPRVSSLPPFASHTDAEGHSALARRQRLETLGVLASGVAHDFNNLLTGILGHLDAAESLLPDGHPAHAELARVHSAASRAAGLARRILNFGRGDETESTVDVIALVEEALPLLRSSVPRTIELHSRIDTPAAHVRIDPTQLQQVLFNLGINGAQAIGAEEGEIVLGVSHVPAEEPPAVDLGQLGPGPHVCLTISDTGSGMDAAIRARIFEAFFTTKPRGVGTGLGLSIVRSIVLQHHGAIAVQSIPGEGTMFRIYLPAEPAPVSPHAPAAAPAAAKPPAARILIVDDEETVVRLATQALEFSGYRTTALPSAEACLEYVTAHPGEVDLIMTDQRMPTMSGLEMVQALRARQCPVPVLITSGSIAAVTLREIQGISPAHFIAKPFTLVDLLGAVKELLQHAGESAAP